MTQHSVDPRELLRAIYRRPLSPLPPLADMPVGFGELVDVVRILSMLIQLKWKELSPELKWATGLNSLRNFTVALVEGIDDPALKCCRALHSDRGGRPQALPNETDLRIQMGAIVRVLASKPKHAEKKDLPRGTNKRALIGITKARSLVAGHIARHLPEHREWTPKMLELWEKRMRNWIAEFTADERRQYANQRDEYAINLQKMTISQLLDEAASRALWALPATNNLFPQNPTYSEDGLNANGEGKTT